MTKFKYGWKQSSGNLGVPQFKVSSTVASLGAGTNSTQHIIPEYAPIFDQLQLQSCVGNATCGMYEILMGLQDPKSVVALSRLFVYWNARLVTGETGVDGGTFIHDALHSLMDKGVCLESSCPYDESKVLNQPTQLAYKEGDDNTLTAFYEITSSDDQRLLDVEAAIRANHPVIFGTQVGKDLEDYDGNPNKVFDFPATSLGGHAILCVGVRRAPDLQFYIRNSWGRNWGINGHFWMSSSYMSNPSTDDLFVGTMMPNLLV